MNPSGKESKGKSKHKNRHVLDVKEGHNVTLECEGDGIPEPMIHWVIVFPAFFRMIHLSPLE